MLGQLAGADTQKRCRQRRIRCDGEYSCAACSPCRAANSICSLADYGVAGTTPAPTSDESLSRFPCRPLIYPGISSLKSGSITSPSISPSSLNPYAVELQLQAQGTQRTTFLGESALLPIVLRTQESGPQDLTQCHHFPVSLLAPNNSEMPAVTAETLLYLKRRGAAVLPNAEVCQHLIDLYFQNVHPQLPMLNKTKFMKSLKCESECDRPSLLLLQVMFLAACRYSSHPSLLDPGKLTTHRACLRFFKRAKAFIDRDYERDQIVVVQASLLLAWCPGVEDLRDVTGPMWHYVGSAVRAAQSIGIHRYHENRSLNRVERNLWKRIWAACIVSDRFLSFFLGYPSIISLETPDAPSLAEDDFEEETSRNQPASLSIANTTHVCYFQAIVDVCTIPMPSLPAFELDDESAVRNGSTWDTDRIAMDLNNWLNHLPDIFQQQLLPRHDSELSLWSGMVYIQYYTILLRLHRVRLDAANSPAEKRLVTDIASTATHMLVKMFQSITSKGQGQRIPPSALQGIFAALLFASSSVNKGSQAQCAISREEVTLGLEVLDRLHVNWIGVKLARSIITEVGRSRKSQSLVRRALWREEVRAEFGSRQTSVMSGQEQQDTRIPLSFNLTDWYNYLGITSTT